MNNTPEQPATNIESHQADLAKTQPGVIPVSEDAQRNLGPLAFVEQPKPVMPAEDIKIGKKV